MLKWLEIIDKCGHILLHCSANSIQGTRILGYEQALNKRLTPQNIGTMEMGSLGESKLILKVLQVL